jgi:thiamine-monophosphate kinase
VKLSDLGEDGVIARIARAAGRRGVAGPRVVLGIGDDAALLRPPAGEDLAVSTDALVEGVHFRLRTESARHVGRRALVANLSDLAAMGASPLGFVLALAAPARLPVRTLDALVAGLLQESRTHGCPLVGGNVARARETSLTITVTGSAPRGRALTRTGVRRGDRICVTGALGAMALHVARAERGSGRVRHVPTPRLRAGRALTRISGIGGCIDLSDGLETDLARLLEGPGLGAEVERARVPLPRGFLAACRRARLDPWRLALAGGEDYELLFTVRPRGPSAASLARRLGVPVHEIGRVLAADRARGAGGTARGFRHFRGAPGKAPSCRFL